MANTTHQSSEKIRVTGVREVQKALKDVDADAPKEARAEFRSIADYVLGRVQQSMPFRSGEAARSLGVSATQRGAGIRFPGGGPGSQDQKGGYYPWLDFGGGVGRKHAIKRPVVKGGRYLYPEIAAASDYIGESALDAIEKVAQAHGFEVRDEL